MSAGNAPSWLFAFVDLAFLLLLGMTQLGVGNRSDVDLGEIVVPRINEVSTDIVPRDAHVLAQIRVHPPTDAEPTAFELVDAAGSERVDGELLEARLRDWRDAGETRPLLAPHDDSRSRDLLSAVSAMEAVWPTRRATVERVVSAK